MNGITTQSPRRGRVSLPAGRQGWGEEKMTWIKVCGITNMDDGLKASSLGVDALGFIFAPSPRRVEPSVAKEIIPVLPKTLLKVGVFVNEDPEEVLRVAEYCSLNVLQFHGQESP